MKEEFCDRCGKKINEIPNVIIPNGTMLPFPRKIKLDLCDDCFKKIWRIYHEN